MRAHRRHEGVVAVTLVLRDPLEHTTTGVAGTSVKQHVAAPVLHHARHGCLVEVDDHRATARAATSCATHWVPHQDGRRLTITSATLRV